MKEPSLILILPGDVEMTFQSIPAGTFRMGSHGYSDVEEPVHRVRITRQFYLGTYPVTQAQFEVWSPEHENGFPNRPNHPATAVFWHEARDFCRWLTEFCTLSIPDGHIAVLPSEAQWEYACRAGSEKEYYTGDGEVALSEAGWYAGNSAGTLMPVGLRNPNAFGLHDMHGNVWEWCWDASDGRAFRRRVDGVCDPKVLGDANAGRVLRGGSCVSVARECRAAIRIRGSAAARSGIRGFRVCLFSGPCPAGQEAEPPSGGVARRDDAAKP